MTSFVTKGVAIKWGLTVAVAAFSFGAAMGGAAGYKWMAAKYYQEKARNTELAAELEAAASRVVIKHETQVVEKIKKIYVKGKEIIKEVPVYVTKDDDAACELRNGFVRLHDDSLRGQASPGATDTDRAPAGVALSRAGEVIAHNNTEHLVCREKLEQWQKFYADLQKTMGKK